MAAFGTLAMACSPRADSPKTDLKAEIALEKAKEAARLEARTMRCAGVRLYPSDANEKVSTYRGPKGSTMGLRIQDGFFHLVFPKGSQLWSRPGTEDARWINIDDVGTWLYRVSDYNSAECIEVPAPPLPDIELLEEDDSGSATNEEG